MNEKKKLYEPKDLQLVQYFWKEELYITTDEIFERARKLNAVGGKEQADFLWEKKYDFPEEWKSYFLVIPEADKALLHIFGWRKSVGAWARYKLTFKNWGGYLHIFCRMLRPRPPNEERGSYFGGLELDSLAPCFC